MASHLRARAARPVRAAGGQANAWADVDGDGDLDYFVAFRGRPNRFYRNDGGRFRDVAPEVGLADDQETRAAAWGDFDADGDADLFIGFADPAIPAKVYRNDAKGSLALTNNDPDGGGHPLLRSTSVMRGRSILVEVTDPNARRSRAGSEVRAYRAGTHQLLSSALVDSGSGYCSQSEMPVHLGIANDWRGHVDIEVITIAGAARHASIVRNIDPDDYRGRSLRIITTR